MLLFDRIVQLELNYRICNENSVQSTSLEDLTILGLLFHSSISSVILNKGMLEALRFRDARYLELVVFSPIISRQTHGVSTAGCCSCEMLRKPDGSERATSCLQLILLAFLLTGSAITEQSFLLITSYHTQDF